MPKRNRAAYMRNYRHKKPSKLSNDDIVQKVHKFLYSDDFPDPDESISKTLGLAHIFHGSFSPSREEIAYVQSQLENIPSNIDVKLQECRQKTIYSLMSFFNLNRTAGTECFQSWWLWRCKNTPSDVRQHVNELWSNFGKTPEPKKPVDSDFERRLKQGYANLSPSEREALGIK